MSIITTNYWYELENQLTKWFSTYSEAYISCIEDQNELNLFKIDPEEIIHKTTSQIKI